MRWRARWPCRATVLGPCRGAGGPGRPGGGAGAGGDPGRCPAGAGGVHQWWDRGGECGALRGLRRAGWPAPTRLLHSASEHPCVAAGHRFPEDAVEILPVDAAGLLDLAALEARLGALAGETVLISVHAANNETGVIQPLAEIVRLARAHGRALVHSDAVQAMGKVPLDFSGLGLDALTLSGHKFAAPKGVGALVLAEGVSLDGAFVRGGGQERRLRCGTESLPRWLAWERRPGSPARSGRRRPSASPASGTGSRPASAPGAGRGGVRGGGTPAAEHVELRRAGARCPRGADRPGPRRGGGLVGFGLLLGQGRALGDARCDGRARRAGGGSAAGESGLEYRGGGCVTPPPRLRTGGDIPI